MRHPRQGFVAWFVRQAIEGEEIELYGGGGPLRDFNEVDDVVDAFLRAACDEAAVGEAFNLGHPEPVTIRQFAETCSRSQAGSVVERPFPDDRAGSTSAASSRTTGRSVACSAGSRGSACARGSTDGRVLPREPRALLVSVRVLRPA